MDRARDDPLSQNTVFGVGLRLVPAGASAASHEGFPMCPLHPADRHFPESPFLLPVNMSYRRFSPDSWRMGGKQQPF